MSKAEPDWKVINSYINDEITKDIKIQKRYERIGIRNKWINEIIRLSKEGYSVEQINKMIGKSMQSEVGHEPLKTIEYFNRKILKEREENILDTDDREDR